MNKKFMGDYKQPGVDSTSGVARVHIIGELKDGAQKCTRCGLILWRGKQALTAAGKSITTEGSAVTVGAEPNAPNCG